MKSNNQELKEKIKKLFINICEDESIYSKEEAITLFENYEFDQDEIEIFPVNMELDEYDEEDDYSDVSLYYSDEIIDDLEEYSDDQEFIITLPDEISNNICSEKFREYILSNMFTNEERIYIFDMLINYVYKYAEHFHVEESIEIKQKMKNFINNCSINQFINKYISDIDFCRFIFEVYEVATFCVEKNVDNQPKKIVSVGDIIREKFCNIHNRNICNGTADSNSILVFLKYLKGEIDPNSMNIVYKKELGDFKIEDICSRNYAKIIMITDYLRMCEIKYKHSSGMDEIDSEYLTFIKSNSVEEILKRFDSDNDFAFNIINDFLELNLFCSKETIKECKNFSLIKKLNIIYPLDFM